MLEKLPLEVSWYIIPLRDHRRAEALQNVLIFLSESSVVVLFVRRRRGSSALVVPAGEGSSNWLRPLDLSGGLTVIVFGPWHKDRVFTRAGGINPFLAGRRPLEFGALAEDRQDRTGNHFPREPNEYFPNLSMPWTRAYCENVPKGISSCPSPLIAQ